MFGTSKGLFRVSAQGGQPSPLTTVVSPESGHFWPHFLPDGRQFLYLAWSGQSGNRAIIAGSLDSKTKTKVIGAESKGAYAEPGYLVFRRESAVYAQPFNAKTLSVSGSLSASPTGSQPAARMATGASASPIRAGCCTTSAAPPGRAPGRRPTPPTGNCRGSSAEADRSGPVGPVGPYRGIEVSPNGMRVAVHRHERRGGRHLHDRTARRGHATDLRRLAA